MWVCFTGDDKLDGSIWISKNFLKTFHIFEDKIGAFIGGESSCEADGECIGVENFVDRDTRIGSGFFVSKAEIIACVEDESDSASLFFSSKFF